MNIIQYFDIETAINDKRNIKGFELENKIKVIFISDPDINISSCSIAVGAGYLQDTFPGTAHFIEHLLFMGSEKYPEQNDYHSYVQINGGLNNAFTADNMTCYYLNLETSFLKKGIEILSWFFRAPLLDEKHINSEMEIIDSEHNKNILMDAWIMDDIFKKFIKSNSKYTKFGTGNLKSLNKITKKDIVDFYNEYYTTDNIYICVVDSKNLEIMIKDYLYYFQTIPTKLSNNNSDKFNKSNLELIKNNCIFYNSSSDYLFINNYIILDANETNLIEYQIIQFINYLIGTEYFESLGYYLKENNIIKNISSSIEYFYDFSTIINIQFIMIDNDIDKINQSNFLLLKLLYEIKNLSEDDFIKIYENFRKIKTLKLLYDSSNDSNSISNLVVENMIKGNIKDAIIRNNKIPEYNKYIYDKYIEILNTIKTKFTTNINFKNIPIENFLQSEWYASSYYIDNISFIQKNKLLDFKLNLNNIIGIENFLLKNNIINKDFTKSLIPELIFEDNKLKRKIYLLEQNKYNKPISSISIIRKNKLLLDKYNKIILIIYQEICDKILNYFLEVMNDYKLSFSINIFKEYIIYNFIGIDYELNYFISQIIKQIHPDVIFYNKNIKKYFNETIRDMIESINNFKYNTPYSICSKYISYLLNNNLLPSEKKDFLNQLTWENFIIKINECLKYSYEYYIMIGIKKYGYKLDISNKKYNFNDDHYINDIIDTLSLNPNKYLENIIQNDQNNINKNLFQNYIITSFDTNPNEINNCIIRYWDIAEINLIYNTNDENKINLEITKQIIKYELISMFISEILNEPLFDKIRTIDKLGYIVKTDTKIIYPSANKLNFLIIFLVQSSYSIDRISESINNFNKFLIKDIKNNYGEYLEKFRLLKESKLIEFKKTFSDLIEELSSYIESIISKNFIFNLNSLYYDICKQINFENDIEPLIQNIVKKKLIYYDIILNKKN
jgi:insulysin